MFYICLVGHLVHAQDVDYDLLAKENNLFDRKTLNLSGIISDTKKIKKDHVEFWSFKLSQSSEVQNYIQVTLYQQIGDVVLNSKEYTNGEIIDLEGEFRSNYEIVDSKKMGDLYVNMKEFNQKRMDLIKQSQSQSYLKSYKNDVLPWATIADIASDYIESENMMIKVSGVVKNIQYIDDKQGNEYWQIEIKDHYSNEKVQRISPYSMTVKYHLVIGGTPVAQINLDEHIKLEQKIEFTGKYLFMEKNAGIIGGIDLNFLKGDGSYHDFYIKKDLSKKNLNKGLVTNSNNDNEHLNQLQK